MPTPKHTARLSHDGQLTIPEEIREAAQLKEGDTVVIEVADDQGLVIRHIDPEQAWFWSREWHEGEREVDEAIARGERGTVYHSTEEFLAGLDERADRLE